MNAQHVDIAQILPRAAAGRRWQWQRSVVITIAVLFGLLLGRNALAMPDGPEQETVLAGQVLDLERQPLAGVEIEVKGRVTHTDEDGRFELSGIPGGPHEMWVDARRAQRDGHKYGTFVVGVDVKPGQRNVYPQVLWMPAIDVAHAVEIPEVIDRDLTITHPNMRGFELRIPSGTVIKNRDGSAVREISITPVHPGQVPFPMVPGYFANWYYMIQPGGAVFHAPADRGVQLIYPNWGRASAGSRYWLRVHAPEKGYGAWEYLGEAEVEASGRRIVPENMARLTRLVGAGATTGNTPSTEPDPGKPPCRPDKAAAPSEGKGPPAGTTPADAGRATCGDPVSLSTGIFTNQEVDISLPDVIPLTVERVHVAADTTGVVRAFGRATFHSLNSYLWRPDINSWQTVVLILADGTRVPFVRTSGGTSGETGVWENTARAGAFFGAQLRFNDFEAVGGRARYELVLRDGTVLGFTNLEAWLSYIRDPNLNQVTFFRDPNNLQRLLRVVSPNGRWLAFTYDGSNRVTQIADNDGRAWNYDYDAQGRLWHAIDPNGKSRTYTYESTTSHRLATLTDARQNLILTNEYWPDGRVKKQTLADGATFQFAYTVNGQGQVTQTNMTDPRGTVRRVQFNAQGLISSDTFALGLPEQQVYTFGYQTATNLLESTTDAAGRTTRYTYNGFGQALTETRMWGTPQAVTTTMTYEPVFQQLATVSDPLSNVTRYFYDGKGNLTTIRDPRNQDTILTPNSQGLVASVMDPNSNTTTFAYDGADLATITDPLSRVARFYTDALGRTRVSRDPLGNTTRYTLDVRDRLTVVTEPMGTIIQRGYDDNGNLTSFRDQKNNLTQFTYDSLNRVKTRQDALLRTDTWDYDIAGWVRQFTDRKSQVSGFTYDGLNRRKTAGFGATTGNPTAFTSTITYTYDLANRVSSIADSLAGTITRQYDNRFDALSQEITPEGQVDLTYDSAGRRASFQVAGQSALAYTFDAASRLTQITQGTTSVGYGYDNANRRTSLTLPNGIVVEYGYNTANELTSLTYKNGATTMGALGYGYDAAGRRTTVTGSYARANLPAAVASAVYNANNQLTNWGGTVLSYDNNGNLTSNTANTYSWDARDQMTGIAGAVTGSFGYDGVGRRRTKTIAGVKTDYLYDGLNFVQEKNGATVNANLLTGLGIDEVYRRTQGATSSDILPDALGSTVALADTARALTTQYTYAPYGETTQTGAANNNTQKFTGREDDGTGLMYYRARYYSPTYGRFTAEDPIGFAGGYNLYVYVGGSPTTGTDPMGLFAPAVPALYYAVPVVAVAAWSAIDPGARESISRGVDAVVRSAKQVADGVKGIVAQSKAWPSGFWPGPKGAEEWGRRNGVDPDEARRRFHEIKQGDKGRPTDDYGVHPGTGAICRPDGEVIDNL